MKIYIEGHTPQELAELLRFCVSRGWDMRIVSGKVGRPKGDYPDQNVLDAYKSVKTVRGAARETGVSPGTASRIIKRLIGS